MYIGEWSFKLKIGSEILEDNAIIDLYWRRSETAIEETQKKYSKYCNYISYNILHNEEDSEECVNDTYLRAWNALPPNRPNCLATFLGKITRNLSLNKFKKYTTEKRGMGQFQIALSELDEVIPDKSNVESIIERKELLELLNKFLEDLPLQKRDMFVQRYWYLMPIKTMSLHLGISESQIKVTLHRIRKDLKTYFESKGVTL